MYKHSPIPKGKKVTYLQLIKEYDEPQWKGCLPIDMKIGDVTWIAETDVYDTNDLVCYLIEDNKYGGNFHSEYFNIIQKGKKEFFYEIY